MWLDGVKSKRIDPTATFNVHHLMLGWAKPGLAQPAVNALADPRPTRMIVTGTRRSATRLLTRRQADLRSLHDEPSGFFDWAWISYCRQAGRPRGRRKAQKAGTTYRLGLVGGLRTGSQCLHLALFRSPASLTWKRERPGEGKELRPDRALTADRRSRSAWLRAGCRALAQLPALMLLFTIGSAGDAHRRRSNGAHAGRHLGRRPPRRGTPLGLPGLVTTGRRRRA